MLLFKDINFLFKCATHIPPRLMTDETVSCSSHNIYPVPQVAWATDPPSAREVLENSTIKTTDHKGLFTVESTLRILGNISDYAYFCSFMSADKTQVWTASRKNQGNIFTEEEGCKLSIPCIAPHNLQNFSLTWTFASSSEPAVILRYDTRTKHTFNLWEGQAELDQDLILLGNGSLLLLSPETQEHTGTYTCTFSGLQSRHTVQTRVNITSYMFKHVTCNTPIALGIVDELCAIFAVPIELVSYSPMCLLLGLPDAHMVNTKQMRLS
uniref:Ig-like domain-containing protein n=1 Tax=Myripristis murdjan TaxID=586833 RepID=A0A667Y2K1_9TELE